MRMRFLAWTGSLAVAFVFCGTGLAGDIPVSVGGVEFVVPAKGGLMVRKTDGKLGRVLSFNLRVDGEDGKAAAYPDGRNDSIEVVEDTSVRYVVRAYRSLSVRGLERGTASAAWDAAHLRIDYVFRKDTPGVVVAERLVARRPFTFFSWNVPVGFAFSRFAVDGMELRNYPTGAEFRATQGGYRTRSGAYVIGETPDGERWWMGREFGTFCPHGEGKPGGFYAVSDAEAAVHGKSVAKGDEITLSVCVGRLRDDTDVERMRTLRKGDGALPVVRFGGDWSRVPVAAWRGETKDYRPVAGLNWNGAADLSFTAKVAQDADGIRVFADVSDDLLANPFSGVDAALGDAVLVGFSNASGSKTLDRVVSALNGRKTSVGYVIETSIGWDELSAVGIYRKDGVRFNLCVSDMDKGTDRENWLGVEDGILGGRNPKKWPFLDFAGVVTSFEPEHPSLPSHTEMKRKIDEIAAANALLPDGGEDEYTSCLKAMTEYFLEFMRSDLDAKDSVSMGPRTRKIDDAYRYYMDDRVNKNADYLLELQRELAERQKALAAGLVRPMKTTRYAKDMRPVIKDGGFKVDGKELLLIGPNTWTNVKGWNNDDIAVIANTGFNRFDCFYVGGTNYFDVVRRCRDGGLYCLWGSADSEFYDLSKPWSGEQQNSYRGGKGYHYGSMVPSNPAPNFVFQVSFPEQWGRKREAAEAWAGEFRNYLEGKFGSLDALNSSLATDYSSWTNIDFSAALKNDALRYESFVCRMKANMCREMPQQRWFASRFGLPRSVHFSTHYNIAGLDPLVSLSDLEALWSMFDVIGFDGGFGFGGSEWAFDFPKGGFELDFARSVYPEKPVANNENHVGSDGVYLEHAKGETYASNMLAFLLGLNSSSIWVWANTRHTFGEYAFTRANTYHETIRCALDLRRFAEEIGAFRHAPNPPFRIFHSLPSLSERDPYVRSLYGLYGAMSFTGWATRFITERHLAKGDFKGARVIVVPDARRVSDGTFAALESFARDGGMVLVDGDAALTKDQWGKPVHSRAVSLAKFHRFPDVSSRSRFAALNAVLAEKGVAPPLDLRTASGEKPFGVMWRTARTSTGEDVAFMANLSKTPIELEIPGEWLDVLSGGARVPHGIRMEPYDIRIIKKEQVW